MNDDVLVAVTVSRDKGEIVYKIDCSSNLTSEELEYYLEEVIEGICKWKPSVCEEAVKSFKGTVRKRKPKKQSKVQKFSQDTTVYLKLRLAPPSRGSHVPDDPQSKDD